MADEIPNIADLQAENDSLKKRLAAMQAKQEQADADEAEIAKKTQHGLTWEQAIAVLKRQRDYDAAEKKRQQGEAAAKKKGDTAKRKTSPSPTPPPSTGSANVSEGRDNQTSNNQGTA